MAGPLNVEDDDVYYEVEAIVDSRVSVSVSPCASRSSILFIEKGEPGGVSGKVEGVWSPLEQLGASGEPLLSVSDRRVPPTDPGCRSSRIHRKPSSLCPSSEEGSIEKEGLCGDLASSVESSRCRCWSRSRFLLRHIPQVVQACRRHPTRWGDTFPLASDMEFAECNCQAKVSGHDEWLWRCADIF